MTGIPGPFKRQIDALIDGADDNLHRYRGQVKREKANPQAIYEGLEEIKAAMSRKFNGTASGSDCFSDVMAYGNAQLGEKFIEYFPEVMKQFSSEPAQPAPKPELSEEAKEAVDFYINAVGQSLEKAEKQGENAYPMVGIMVKKLIEQAGEIVKKHPAHEDSIREYMSREAKNLARAHFPNIPGTYLGEKQPAAPTEAAPAPQQRESDARKMTATEFLRSAQELHDSLKTHGQQFDTRSQQALREMDKAINRMQQIEMKSKKRPLVRSGYITTLLLTALGAIGYIGYEELREDSRDQQAQIAMLSEELDESETRQAAYRDENLKLFGDQDKKLDEIASKFLEALESYQTELASFKELQGSNTKAAEARGKKLADGMLDLDKMLQAYMDLDTKRASAAKGREDAFPGQRGILYDTSFVALHQHQHRQRAGPELVLGNCVLKGVPAVFVAAHSLWQIQCCRNVGKIAGSVARTE